MPFGKRASLSRCMLDINFQLSFPGVKEVQNQHETIAQLKFVAQATHLRLVGLRAHGQWLVRPQIKLRLCYVVIAGIAAQLDEQADVGSCGDQSLRLLARVQDGHEALAIPPGLCRQGPCMADFYVAVLCRMTKGGGDKEG
jgi:hypothetical protein